MEVGPEQKEWGEGPRFPTHTRVPTQTEKGAQQNEKEKAQKLRAGVESESGSCDREEKDWTGQADPAAFVSQDPEEEGERPQDQEKVSQKERGPPSPAIDQNTQDLEQPLMIQPWRALPREGEGLRGRDPALLKDEAPGGKVPPEIIGTDRLEDGHRDGEGQQKAEEVIGRHPSRP